MKGSIYVSTEGSIYLSAIVNENAKEMVSPTHIYVFVNLRIKKGADENEFFVVPSAFVAENMVHEKSKTGSEWWSISLDAVVSYRNNWALFAASGNT